MTRTHALKRLLEHGPLTFGQVVAITGWEVSQVRGVLSNLVADGTVQAEGKRMKMVYSLTGEDFPDTNGWPKLAGVLIETRASTALPSVPLVQKAVAQVLDYYGDAA